MRAQISVARACLLGWLWLLTVTLTRVCAITLPPAFAGRAHSTRAVLPHSNCLLQHSAACKPDIGSANADSAYRQDLLRLVLAPVRALGPQRYTHGYSHAEPSRVNVWQPPSGMRTHRDDVEDAVKRSGLFPYDAWSLAPFPAELYAYCGRGLGLWQYHVQFAHYLDFLRALSHVPSAAPIRTYVEIGVAAGGTFIFTHEYLQQLYPDLRSFAVDIAPMGKVSYMVEKTTPFDGLLQEYMRTCGPSCEFVHGNATTFTKVHPKVRIDVLMIDGDHSYEGVTADFLTLADRARIIIFHDITNDYVPDVGKFWREITRAYPRSTFEFTHQYAGVPGKFLGIGVLVIDPELQNVWRPRI